MISGRSGLLALAVLAWCTGVADAAEGGPAELDLLMQRMASVKSASAKFVERRELRLLEKPVESSGTLLYTAPDRLERHTLRPRTESMILSRDMLTLEDRARNRTRSLPLQQYPLIWAFAESLRSVLAGDLATLRRFYEVDYSGDAGNWTLLMRPRDAEMRRYVDDIRIHGSENVLRVVEVNQTGGDRSVMTVSGAAREQ